VARIGGAFYDLFFGEGGAQVYAPKSKIRWAFDGVIRRYPRRVPWGLGVTKANGGGRVLTKCTVLSARRAFLGFLEEGVGFDRCGGAGGVILIEC